MLAKMHFKTWIGQEGGSRKTVASAASAYYGKEENLERGSLYKKIFLL